MYLTDEVRQEHDEAVCKQITNDWDITMMAFLDGQRFKVPLRAAEDLVKSDCAHAIVTGSLEHKIVLVQSTTERRAKGLSSSQT